MSTSKKETIRVINTGTKEEIATAMKAYWKKHGVSYEKALDVFFSDKS